MATTPVQHDELRDARRYLSKLAARAPATRRSMVLALLDAGCAIGFAGGLAGAVASLAAGDSAWMTWTLLIVAASAGRGAIAMASVRLGERASRMARQGLRARLVARLLGETSTSHSVALSGSMSHRVVDAVESLDGYMARFVPARLGASIAPLVVLGAVAVASPVAAVILAATLVPFIVLMMMAGTASASESRRQFEALDRVSGLFADRVRGLPVVLACGAEEREAGRVAKASSEVARRTMRILKLAFLSSAVLEFFAALCVALVAVYAGFDLLGLLPFPAPEKLTFGKAFFILALAPEFYAPMRRLAAAYHDRQAAETSAAHLMAMEARAGDAPPSKAAVASSRMPASIDIRFDGAQIRYAGQDTACVCDLSFHAAPGRMIALVGPSGSGKTSILKSLLAMAPVTGGRILVDGEALGSGESLAERAVWVGQSPVLMPGSIRDNLRLAWPAASDDAVVEAARLVGLSAMLAGRGAGLDTVLDERGGGLSGGERRRVALARALLKPAHLWLLDEPTAHLDEASEEALIRVIAQAAKGRTVIIATHSERLAATADAVVRLGVNA